MRVAMFYHSLLSEWNHGNAHFLRGIATELVMQGHDVHVLEPQDSWSYLNLVKDHGEEPVSKFRKAYPGIDSTRYNAGELDLDATLEDVDLVLVHEWNEPELVSRIGNHRARSGRYRLLFHDTHHRSVTDPDSMGRYDLDKYDGVLAFGNSVAEQYRRRGWGRRVWTWHEAADVRVFHPLPTPKHKGDLVWIGNWGDDERTAELKEFLIDPVRELGIQALVHGVRYPQEAVDELREAGIEYGGWLPNFEAPEVFARHKLTIHVPRAPYATALPGVPTIRIFEALACGMPLVSAPWEDSEHLFEPGADFLFAHNGAEMKGHLERLLSNADEAAALGAHGRRTILERHTCGHRVAELLDIYRHLEEAPSRQSRHYQGTSGLNIAFFGSSLLSAYWNGAATYYRGIIKALHNLGHRVTFYEPDAFERQQHRDLEEPEWARVHVYNAQDTDGVFKALDLASNADWVIKASGVGVFDELLEREVLRLRRPNTQVAFWDVDAAATLDRLEGNPNDPFAGLVGQYDLIFTYGGGRPVIRSYSSYGARECIPIYNALDPSTHYPVVAEARFQSDLSFLGNRLPDREARVDEFFFNAARCAPDAAFLLGGSGWPDKLMPRNVTYAGHVYTADHNAFNCTPRAVLNISRDSMARYGYSPATRVFEAAGAGACLITDYWEGIEQFLEPGREVLVAQDGGEVAGHLQRLTEEQARCIGQAALRRVLNEHTYAHRAAEVDAVLSGAPCASSF